MADADIQTLIAEIAAAVDELRDDQAPVLVDKAVSQGADAERVLKEGIMAGMKRTGEKFGRGEYFLAELLMGSEIANNCIARVTPHLRSTPRKTGKVVIGTVAGDIHSIGKDLVAMQLRMGGFEVHDLGIDVPAMKFIEKATATSADIIALSAFLTSTIPYMAEIVKYIEDMGLHGKFRIIIGGTGTGTEYARQIGAHGWAKDCFDAVKLCEQLVTSRGY